MNGKIFFLLVPVLLAASCAAWEPLSVREGKYGTAPPVIAESYASPTAPHGDTWKIYLKASDPDGDMKAVVSYLERGGRGGDRSAAFLALEPESRKEFSGYLYWYPGPQAAPFFEVVVTLQVEDRAGHFSKPLSFPLRVLPSGGQEPPPPGVFEERELGPILINLSPVGGGGSP